MSSSVFFKFKSSKEPQRITFDGTGISVFELKREIIAASGLGDGNDFDLSIYTDDNTEEYDDDTTIIPRSTTVIARRLPAARPGHGKAARYVSGKAPVTAKNTHRQEPVHSKPATQRDTPVGNGTPVLDESMTEEERIAAMFKAGGDQWEQQKQQMANAKPVFQQGRHKNAKVPNHPPPEGYICYRCHQKGHWIMECPTNDDPNFDNRPRIKRTTGIPRSFLKTVEKPVAMTGDGITEETKAPSGVMVNAEGEYVIAEPDKASWDLYQAKAIAAKEQQKELAKGNEELREKGLECPLDSRMFVEPMKTPCCGTTYCNECIENALIDSEFVCPNCGKDGVLIDNLVSDQEMVKRIAEFEDQKSKERQEKDRSNSPPKEPTPQAQSTGSPATSNAKPKSPTPTPGPDAADTTPTNSDGTPVNGASNPKKRPAEEELQNDHIPKAPAAMRKQQEASKAVQDAATKAADPTQKMMQELNSFMPNGQAFNFPNFSGASFPNQMAMMNPAMGSMPMNGMPMGMPGMPNMGMGMGMPPNMMGMPNNPMMNQMMMQQGNTWGGMNGGMNGMGHQGGWNNNQRQYQNGWGNGYQQQNRMQNGYGHQNQQGHWPGQQPPPGNEEDNAYFRKPVNPHRHQNRQKRQWRPTDYTEI